MYQQCSVMLQETSYKKKGRLAEVVACSVRVSDKIGRRCTVLAACGFGDLIQCRQDSQVLIRTLFMELWGLVFPEVWGAGTSHPFPPPLLLPPSRP